MIVFLLLVLASADPEPQKDGKPGLERKEVEHYGNDIKNLKLASDTATNNDEQLQQKNTVVRAPSKTSRSTAAQSNIRNVDHLFHEMDKNDFEMKKMDTYLSPTAAPSYVYFPLDSPYAPFSTRHSGKPLSSFLMPYDGDDKSVEIRRRYKYPKKQPNIIFTEAPYKSTFTTGWEQPGVHMRKKEDNQKAKIGLVTPVVVITKPYPKRFEESKAVKLADVSKLFPIREKKRPVVCTERTYYDGHYPSKIYTYHAISRPYSKFAFKRRGDVEEVFASPMFSQPFKDMNKGAFADFDRNEFFSGKIKKTSVLEQPNVHAASKQQAPSLQPAGPEEPAPSEQPTPSKPPIAPENIAQQEKLASYEKTPKTDTKPSVTEKVTKKDGGKDSNDGSENKPEKPSEKASKPVMIKAESVDTPAKYREAVNKDRVKTRAPERSSEANKNFNEASVVESKKSVTEPEKNPAKQKITKIPENLAKVSNTVEKQEEPTPVATEDKNAESRAPPFPSEMADMIFMRFFMHPLQYPHMTF